MKQLVCRFSGEPLGSAPYENAAAGHHPSLWHGRAELCSDLVPSLTVLTCCFGCNGLRCGNMGVSSLQSVCCLIIHFGMAEEVCLQDHNIPHI